MKTVKRIEIIVSHAILEDCIALLEKGKAEGYTIISPVEGKGSRGIRDSLGLTNAFSNAYILWFATANQWETLQPKLKDLFAKAGGVASVSEAQWLE